MGYGIYGKSFDRLKHSLLFKKLIDRRVPGYIIRIVLYLVIWYASQTMHVRWSGILSHGFHVANGVRQGRILSPYLFNAYIDDLSIALSECRTGCCVSNMIMNYFMYVDDLVIFSPSSVALRSYVKDMILAMKCDLTIRKELK